MEKIKTLTIANIRKNKGASVSLLILTMIAAALLNIGLVLYVDFGAYFDARAEQLNAPHSTILQSGSISTDEQEEYLREYPGVEEFEKQQVIAGYGDYYMNGSKAPGIIIFADAENEQRMNPPQLIGKSLPLDGGSVYVPYLMKTAGGYALGDSFNVNLAEKELHFTIAGFTEEVTYGAIMNTIYRFYVSGDRYERLSAEFPGQRCCLQSVRLEDSGLGTQIQLDYAREFFYSEHIEEASSLFIESISYNAVKTSRTFIPTITSVIVIAFSAILLLISLIVIRFRVINSIEEGMTNIGVLKAMGYGSRTIMASILAQFGGIAAAGGITGIVLSRLVLPALAEVLGAQSAVIWTPSFNFGLAAVTVIIILAAVALISFAASRRIRGLQPLTALRQGMRPHNFRKNRAPLDRAHGPAPVVLALKQLLNNKRQAVMIAMIIAIVSFTSVAAMSIYYNVGVETDEFVSVVAGEVPDAGLMLKDREETDRLIGKLAERPDVRKAFGYQNVNLLTEGYNVAAFIARDFDALDDTMLYEGRYPKYDNEVALNGLLAETLGKNIGDSVTVKQGGAEKEFLVTGIIQLMQNEGVNMIMTYDGLLSVQDDYRFDQIYVYLGEGASPKDFIADIKKSEGDIFSSTVDMGELVDAQFSSYGGIFAVVAVGVLAVTAVVVALALYLVIRTIIIRRKRELGIQKALGYTTLQLMLQTAFIFMPIVAVGVAAGGLAGYFGFNPLFAALTHSVGIIETHLPSPTAWTVSACLALVAFAYLMSMLISGRIRKISPYTLVSE
ncbi:MAG: ABC transporter permease [Clostridiales Family XIII bacterium]|jgi:putative ABC transport system permease protein|nr:ABC transporter permease [Clostridiales Family XIII bacterium]